MTLTRCWAALYVQELDTKDPELVVTSSPAAKAAYYDGKQVRFEFACKSDSCTYMCRVDGKDSADGTDSDRSDGYFSCTSPTKVRALALHNYL